MSAVSRASTLAALLAALVLCGCGDDAGESTEVVLLIDAEPALRDRIEVLQLATAGGDSPDALESPGAPMELARGEIRWPQRALLTPMGGDPERVFVADVAALDGSGALLVRARVVSGYVAGERVSVSILLAEDCVELACDADSTCDQGRCVDPYVDPRDPGAARRPRLPEDGPTGDPVVAPAGDGDVTGGEVEVSAPGGDGDVEVTSEPPSAAAGGDGDVDAPGGDGDVTGGDGDAGGDGDVVGDGDGDGDVTGGDGDAAPGCGGRVDAPCAIADCDALVAIAARPEAHYALTQAIDCSGRALAPIARLAGSLDGAGFSILAPSIVAADGDGVGLFAELDGAQVRALSVTGAQVQGRDGVGVLAGVARGATIDQVHVDGSVSGRDDVGGLVGSASASVVTQSYSTAAVTASSGALLIGRVWGEGGSVRDSYAAAAISGPAPALLSGGETEVVASFYACELAGACNAADPHALRLQLAGRIGRLAALGWDFATPVWGARAQYALPCLRFEPLCSARALQSEAPAGAGSEADPYRIGSCAQLQWMARRPGAHYVLSGDVDCAGYHVGDHHGFWPIGTRAAPFSGVLDGAGFAIEGLTIRRPWLDDVALLGHVSGRVENLELRGALVMGGRRVGLLASELSGELRTCHVQGHVLGRADAGAVVGAIAGGTVQDCTGDAQITAKE